MKIVKVVFLTTIALCAVWPAFSAGGQDSARTAAPAVPVEVEFLGNRPQNTPPDAENFVIQTISQKLGITYKHTGFTDGADIQRNLGLRIASGNPPEFFLVGNRATVNSLNIDGALLDIGPYSDKLPVWRKLVSNDRLIDQSKINGKLVTLIAPPSVNYEGLYIRKDWLDKLGLKVPTTLDELFSVAKAFTFDDPDGNGRKDTYGLTGNGHNTFAPIYGGYGTMGAVFNGGSGLHMMIENGKAVFDFYNPRYPQALAEIKKWMDAQIVDPEVFTHKVSDMNNKAYQGRVGIIAGRWPEMRKPEFEKVIKEVNPNAVWMLIQPPKGPYGSYHGGFAKGSASQISLSAKLAEPKNAAKLQKTLELVEYLSDEKGGQTLTNFGQEGVHFKVEGGKIVALPKMSELTWTWAFNIVGRKDSFVLPVKFAYAEKDVLAAIAYPFLDAPDKLVGAFPESIPKADIDRTVSDNLIKFVYGARPLSEFPAFVKELEEKNKYKEYVAFLLAELKTQQ